MDNGSCPLLPVPSLSTLSSSISVQTILTQSSTRLYDDDDSQVRDLLSKNPDVALELKEHKETGVYVKGLNAFVVKSVGELRNVVEVSDQVRTGMSELLS